MLRKTTLIAAALLGSALAVPAMAQDASTDASSFTGFYGGAEVGYAKPKTKLDLTPKTGAAAGGSTHKTGFDYGGFVGYGAVLGESLYLGARRRWAPAAARPRATWPASGSRSIRAFATARPLAPAS
ncbi:hypothetical protein ACRAWD_21565 [Caulobacter segnis]